MRPLLVPHPCRLAEDHPKRQEILDRHSDALRAGDAGYRDPGTRLFVFSAAYLAQRGKCCNSGCRHCPYIS
ncbi:MAG: DUF5522 domain-containing protein [Acidimicrobiales bacterium]